MRRRPAISACDHSPVVDLTSSTRSGGEAEDWLVDRLVEASKGSGFFQVCGHGVPGSCIAACRAAAKAFFVQELHRKLKYIANSPTSAGFAIRSRRGYSQGAPPGESTHLKEIFDVGPPDRAARLPTLPGFLTAVHDYYHRMERLENLLSVLLSLALARTAGVDLPADFLRNGRGRHKGLLRLNYYPQRHGAGRLRDAPHVDWTPFTIIHTEQPGLEILERGCWNPVAATAETFTILIGEQLEIWSDGLFRAARHRVRAGDLRDGPRLSFAFFGTEAIDMDDDTKIEPVRSGAAPACAPVVIRDYLTCRFAAVKETSQA